MSVKTLKYVALAETISWTLLLISMIFKYGFDQAAGVQLTAFNRARHAGTGATGWLVSGHRRPI